MIGVVLMHKTQRLRTFTHLQKESSSIFTVRFPVWNYHNVSTLISYYYVKMISPDSLCVSIGYSF